MILNYHCLSFREKQPTLEHTTSTENADVTVPLVSEKETSATVETIEATTSVMKLDTTEASTSAIVDTTEAEASAIVDTADTGVSALKIVTEDATTSGLALDTVVTTATDGDITGESESDLIFNIFPPQYVDTFLVYFMLLLYMNNPINIAVASFIIGFAIENYLQYFTIPTKLLVFHRRMRRFTVIFYWS